MSRAGWIDGNSEEFLSSTMADETIDLLDERLAYTERAYQRLVEIAKIWQHPERDTDARLALLTLAADIAHRTSDAEITIAMHDDDGDFPDLSAVIEAGRSH